MSEPLPPLDALDGIFELPEHVTDPNLRAMYEVLITRMRRELQATRSNTNTIELLLCERAAYNYILMKSKDQVAIGEEGGFSSMSAVKEFNTFWLALSKQLNEIMRQSNEEFKVALRDAVAKALAEALSKTVQDKRLRDTLSERIVREIAAAGI